MNHHQKRIQHPAYSELSKARRRIVKAISTGCTVILGLYAFATECKADPEWTMTSVGSWVGVGSLSVSQSEDYMVFSQLQPDGTEKAYEANATNGGWGTAQPIEMINAIGSVGGLFLTDDCKRLYFHADANDGMGYDIYLTECQGGKWSKPKRINDICTPGDEKFPSVVEGGLEIYFLRHQVTSDAKAEKKEGDKLSIYHAQIGKNGKWGRTQPINPAISFGFVQDARIMRDGETLLYSTRPEKRDKARPVFTRKTIAEQWLLPEYMNEDDSRDFLCLQNAGDHLYMILPSSRKSNYGTIFRTATSSSPKYKNKPMVTEQGKVINKQNHRPVEATIEVRNPTTNDLIGVFKSTADEGEYHVVCKPSTSYLISVRAEGYSFFSQLIQYDKQGTPKLPRTIELFDTASIGVTLFDNDIYQPIDGKVIAVRQSDKSIFRATKGRTGWSSIRLPLGSDYNIIATAKGFGENSFLFKIAGDIVFDHYEREIPMSPVRREMNIRIYDDVTNNDILCEAWFKSLDRDESLTLKSGESNISLREGDKYAITVHPKGYMFANVALDLQKYADTKIEIPLTALLSGASLQLHDILFDSDQAYLRDESYAELDRVVRLMNENSDLRIKIQAHTDSQASANHNKKLSERRAEAVLQYLLESGITRDRLQAVGCGASKPIADNDTEEGRQKNRRVELLIIE